MATTSDFGHLDLTDFTVGAMLRAGIAVRRQVRGAESLEEAANAVVHYLYDQCLDPVTGDRACALVRFYATQPLGRLPGELRRIATTSSHAALENDVRCLTLMATVGEREEWNARQQSRGHQAIPLPTAESVRAAPMILRLVEDLGVDIEALVSRDDGRSTGAPTYDVFHVEEARGSPYIPAQNEFVIPNGIASVVGFGGLLRTGELFAVILFSRVKIPATSAARFKSIALDVRSALFTLGDVPVWKR